MPLEKNSRTVTESEPEAADTRHITRDGAAPYAGEETSTTLRALNIVAVEPQRTRSRTR